MERSHLLLLSTIVLFVFIIGCGSESAGEAFKKMRRVAPLVAPQTSSAAATFCTDSDVAEASPHSIKGSVRLTPAGTEVSDRCSDSSTLVEQVCRGNAVAETTVNCSTALGDVASCRDGACVLFTCEDSDDGLDYEEGGTVRSSTELELTDECKEVFYRDHWAFYDSIISEAVCNKSDPRRVYYVDYDCSTHFPDDGNASTRGACRGGVCVNANYVCTADTDGNNLEVPGNITVGRRWMYADSCQEEFYCLDGNTPVRDFYPGRFGSDCYNGYNVTRSDLG